MYKCGTETTESEWIFYMQSNNYMSVGSPLSQYPSEHWLNSVDISHVAKDLAYLLMVRLFHCGP